jgi:hypothetical protein
MNDLTDSKVLIGELVLCNAVKDIYFTRMMTFKTFYTKSSVQKIFDEIQYFRFYSVIIVVHNTIEFKLKSFLL